MVPALLKQGACLTELHRYEEAIPVYETVLAKNAKETTALAGLSTALEALGRTKDAFAVSVKLSLAEPKDANAWARRARLAKAAGDAKDALAAITKASSIAPDHADYLRMKRDLLLAHHSFKAAADVGERLLEIDAQIGRAHV